MEASCTPPRGSSSEEANCSAEGRVRARECDEARARWRSCRLERRCHGDTTTSQQSEPHLAKAQIHSTHNALDTATEQDLQNMLI